MRSLAVALLSALHQLAIALWLGGMLALGALAAPAVFGAAKQAGDTHWGTPLYNFAGAAMGEAFRRYNGLAMAAGLIAAAAGLGYGYLAGLCPIRLRVRAGLTAAAWAVTAWQALVLYPQMLAVRNSGQMDAFDAMHKTYASAGHAQALLLMGVLLLTGYLHFDHTPHGAPESAASSTAEPLPVP